MACGIFPDQGSNPHPLALAGGFFTTEHLRKPEQTLLKLHLMQANSGRDISALLFPFQQFP